MYEAISTDPQKGSEISVPMIPEERGVGKTEHSKTD